MASNKGVYFHLSSASIFALFSINNFAISVLFFSMACNKGVLFHVFFDSISAPFLISRTSFSLERSLFLLSTLLNNSFVAACLSISLLLPTLSMNSVVTVGLTLSLLSVACICALFPIDFLKNLSKNQPPFIFRLLFRILSCFFARVFLFNLRFLNVFLL